MTMVQIQSGERLDLNYGSEYHVRRPLKHLILGKWEQHCSSKISFQILSFLTIYLCCFFKLLSFRLLYRARVFDSTDLTWRQPAMHGIYTGTSFDNVLLVNRLKSNKSVRA